MKGSQGRNSRYLYEGTEAETVEECSPWLAQYAFLYNPGLPAQAWYTHSGLGPPTSITKKMSLQACL